MFVLWTRFLSLAPGSMIKVSAILSGVFIS